MLVLGVAVVVSGVWSVCVPGTGATKARRVGE